MRANRLTVEQGRDARQCLRQCLLFSRLDDAEIEKIHAHNRLVDLAENDS